MDVQKCTDDDLAVGLERDTWGEAVFHTSSNESACLQRAADQFKTCGGNPSDHVTAIFAPTGDAHFFTLHNLLFMLLILTLTGYKRCLVCVAIDDILKIRT